MLNARFRKKSGFSFPYFNDDLFYSAVFTPRPTETQIKSNVIYSAKR